MLIKFWINNCWHLAAPWYELGGYRSRLNRSGCLVVPLEDVPFSRNERSLIQRTGGLSYLTLGKLCQRQHDFLGGRSLRYTTSSSGCVCCQRQRQKMAPIRPVILKNVPIGTLDVA